MKASRKYIIGVKPEVQKITVDVKFASAPTSAVATIAPRKYNKKNHWAFEWDDATFGAFYGLGVLNYAFYTDGCGNLKKYSGTLAINGANETSGLEYTYDGSDGRVSVADMNSMIDAGWEISDHSYYHDPVGHGSDKTSLWNTQQMQDYIKRLLNYWTRTKVVPTNYPGHATAAYDLGYLYSTSQGTFDGFTAEWQFAPPGNWSAVTPVFAALRRDFTDEWESSLASLKSMVDTMVAGTGKFFRVGSHTINVSAFRELVDYLVENTNDTFLVSSTREWLEYDEIKVKPFTQKLVGDTLTIETDITSLDPKMRWKDQSFNIVSDQQIISVTTNGDSASFNPTTGLVNSFKQKKSWT